MNDKISFVILTWNSERYIDACLRSVLDIGDICFEVHVVDNGSSDATLSLVRSLVEQDNRIRLYELESNLGTTVSRNIALHNVSSQATHICILDSDTVVNRDALVSLLSALSNHPEVGVVGPAMSSSSGNLQLSGRNLPTLSLKIRKACPFGHVGERAASEEQPTSPAVDGLQDVGYLLSACWLMPVRSLQKVGFLDEEIFYAPEDVDWCLRCHKVGLRVCLCPDAKIIHEYQRISKKKMLSRMNFEHIKGLVYFFRKHRYVFRTPYVAAIGD